METIDKDFSNTDLVITTSSKNHLLYAAKWASFLSTIGFISLGLMIFGGLLMFAIGSSFSGIRGVAPLGMFSLIYIGAAAIYFFPIYYLYLFAKKIKKALNSANQSDLEGGLEYLKSLFKFLGIFTIIIISLYILIFLIGIVAALAIR